MAKRSHVSEIVGNKAQFGASFRNMNHGYMSFLETKLKLMSPAQRTKILKLMKDNPEAAVMDIIRFNKDKERMNKAISPIGSITQIGSEPYQEMLNDRLSRQKYKE